jgi:hypothetical protein
MAVIAPLVLAVPVTFPVAPPAVFVLKASPRTSRSVRLPYPVGAVHVLPPVKSVPAQYSSEFALVEASDTFSVATLLLLLFVAIEPSYGLPDVVHPEIRCAAAAWNTLPVQENVTVPDSPPAARYQKVCCACGAVVVGAVGISENPAGGVTAFVFSLYRATTMMSLAAIPLGYVTATLAEVAPAEVVLVCRAGAATGHHPLRGTPPRRGLACCYSLITSSGIRFTADVVPAAPSS